jgi:hypothetical protein
VIQKIGPDDYHYIRTSLYEIKTMMIIADRTLQADILTWSDCTGITKQYPVLHVYYTAIVNKKNVWTAVC